VLSFIFISCNQKVEIQYYETGEIHKIKKRINKHETEVRFYFKDGQIEREGILYADSLKDGHWKFYYNDGVLRGEIVYSKDKFIREVIKYPIVLDFKNSPTEFKVGNTYQFRVLGVFFHSAGFTGIPKKTDFKPINDYVYLLEFTPKIASNDTILVIIDHFNKEIKNDSIFFPIKIIEQDSVPFW